jgi:3-hydroxy-9,10-secoandrosta-1,3,5(10)-triene-9,17-dione monooxygenase
MGDRAELRVTPDVIEILAAHADASEKARQLAPESVKAMRDAGLFRALVPKSHNGLELSLGQAARLIRDCMAGCSAAGWVLMVSAGHDWMLGAFPHAVQDEIWADGPDQVTPGALAPQGDLVPAQGGFNMTGRWSFNSGAAHGSWFILGAADHTGDKPRLFHTMVPRADLNFDDNWFVLGLEGTGSIDITVENLFVPKHRTLDSRDLFGGRSKWAERHATNVYKTPVFSGLSSILASAMLGIAENGLEAAKALILDQKDRYTGRPKADRPGLHMRLAQSVAELQCAEHLLSDNFDLLEIMAEGGTTSALRAQAKFQATYSAELSRRSIDRLISATGSRSAWDDSPLLKAFRDLTMGAKHETINFDNACQGYGRVLLGLDLGGYPV